MTTPNNCTTDPAALRLVITRVLNAPCHLVYQAWADPVQLAQWFSPQAAGCRSVSADLKVGGAFRIHMLCGKGESIAFGHYREIVPNQRLQFTWQWDHYAMPDSVVTVEFEDLGQTTRLTLTHEGLPDQKDVADHTRGWTSLADNFARFIEQPEIATA